MEPWKRFQFSALGAALEREFVEAHQALHPRRSGAIGGRYTVAFVELPDGFVREGIKCYCGASVSVQGQPDPYDPTRPTYEIPAADRAAVEARFSAVPSDTVTYNFTSTSLGTAVVVSAPDNELDLTHYEDW